MWEIFHSLWMTFSSIEAHVLFLSLFHFSSLTHNTHRLANMYHYDCVCLFVFSQLYIQNYSPWSIQLILVLVWYRRWLLKASRIRSKLLLWPLWLRAPSTIYNLVMDNSSMSFISFCSKHAGFPSVLRYTRQDTLST